MTRPPNERRAHKRLELACPVVVTDGAGNELVRARTLNVSDGGSLLAPASKGAKPGQAVRVELRLPRSTENTFMYEQFRAGARVVRRQGAEGGQAVAVAFDRPLALELEA